jgi:uncharacterized membrane protein YsdA (DUF1294 family)
MEKDLLVKFLKKKNELDCFDFKSRWKIYNSNDDNKINIEERDELIKDVLGLANGNGIIVKKTKYLIVGADDKKFDENGMRVLYNVDYRVPSQSEITQWINGACLPSVVGIECEYVSINDKRLYVVTIPPTFGLHETIHELNAKGKFPKFTVFMRQDEHTVPASERDRDAIKQLKFLYRQEIANPPAVLFGAIVGAIIALVFWSMGYDSAKAVNGLTEVAIKCLIIAVGGAFGAEAGYIFREGNTIRYDWRYKTRQDKIWIVLVPVITLSLALVLWLLVK